MSDWHKAKKRGIPVDLFNEETGDWEHYGPEGSGG